MKNKVVITCAITGGIHTPTLSDAGPYTPSDIAHQAIAAAQAGAAILHVHARDPETGGLTQKASPLALLLIGAVVIVKMGAKQYFGAGAATHARANTAATATAAAGGRAPAPGDDPGRPSEPPGDAGDDAAGHRPAGGDHHQPRGAQRQAPQDTGDAGRARRP